MILHVKWIWKNSQTKRYNSISHFSVHISLHHLKSCFLAFSADILPFELNKHRMPINKKIVENMYNQ